MIKDEIQEWSVAVDSFYNTAQKFVKEHPLPQVPEYSAINNRQVLYEAYANIVHIYNNVSSFSTRIQELLVVRINLRRVLKMETLGPSVRATYDNFIAEVYERIAVIDKFVSTYKVGVENQIRFYQSIQYILSSPRLNTLT